MAIHVHVRRVIISKVRRGIRDMGDSRPDFFFRKKLKLRGNSSHDDGTPVTRSLQTHIYYS